jgi:hypothetical protein
MPDVDAASVRWLNCPALAGSSLAETRPGAAAPLFALVRPKMPTNDAYEYCPEVEDREVEAAEKSNYRRARTPVNQNGFIRVSRAAVIPLN